MKKNKTTYQRCQFCGRGGSEGVSLIQSPCGGIICNECTDQVSMIFASKGEESTGSGSYRIGRIPTPSELVRKLDEYVIGQDEAKKTLAVAVYNHYCRLAAKDGFGADGESLSREDIEFLKDVEIEKSNILMIGPTGCGKTLLAKTIAKILKVPFAIADATTLTEAGYVGEDVENIIRYAYNNANHDVSLTQRAIVWVDEIDKIASKTQNVSITRDVSGEGVQQALLKIVEGTKCRFPPKGGRKHPDQELVEIDTSDILFICGGAFVGLDKIVEERISRESGSHCIGFSCSKDLERESRAKSEASVRPEDLVKFGLIPEFVGRLPIVTEMKELSEDELLRVLTEPKNSLVNQYRKLLRLSHVNVEFSNQSLRNLARLAIERKTGARGLRAEMEKTMRDVMFSAPAGNRGNVTIVIPDSQAKNAA